MMDVPPGPSARLPDLNESNIDPDPLRLFSRWFEVAQTSGLALPEAMALATVGLDGRPTARMVLLRGLDQRGFVFFTNYHSRKGQELAVRPEATLLFHWAALERQVRIEGRVEQINAEESDEYFQSRPRGSRLAAWASPQSEVIPDREFLKERMAEFETRFGDGPVPRPPIWGGYRVAPDRMEFWQGCPNRLHNRFRYTRLDGIERYERIHRGARREGREKTRNQP